MAAYCTVDELSTLSIRKNALTGIANGALVAAIAAASDEIDDYLGSQFTLPLISWPNSLRRHCANMAVYTAMRVRGYDPSRPGDEVFKDGYDEAIRYLTKISNGDLAIQVLDSASGSTPGKPSGAVRVSSNPGRGYNTTSGNRIPFTGGRR